MLAKEVMTKGVSWVSPGDSLQQAAKKMKELGIGVLPVCDGQKLTGMLTDRDIVVRAAAEGKDTRVTLVSEVMSPDIEYCLEDESVEKIAQRMEKRKIRRLPVIDHHKKLAGIISLSDLATRGSEQAACEVLGKVSQP